MPQTADTTLAVQTVPTTWLFLARDAYSYLALLEESVDDLNTYVPRTYAEAMKCPDLWGPAIQAELRMMEEQEVFCLVSRLSLPAGRKIIGCRWVFANKFDVEGNVVKRKARLVTKGYSQVLGRLMQRLYGWSHSGCQL